MTFTLTSVVPWGRSFDEYQRMLSLSEDDLRGSILFLFLYSTQLGRGGNQMMRITRPNRRPERAAPNGVNAPLHV